MKQEGTFQDWIDIRRQLESTYYDLTHKIYIHLEKQATEQISPPVLVKADQIWNQIRVNTSSSKSGINQSLHNPLIMMV
jgi:hypothetical protein